MYDRNRKKCIFFCLAVNRGGISSKYNESMSTAFQQKFILYFCMCSLKEMYNFDSRCAHTKLTAFPLQAILFVPSKPQSDVSSNAECSGIYNTVKEGSSVRRHPRAPIAQVGTNNIKKQHRKSVNGMNKNIILLFLSVSQHREKL